MNSSKGIWNAKRRRLFIVSRTSPELASHLRQQFATEVEVIVDRRRGERRHASGGADADRRLGDRRLRPEVDKEVGLTSFAFVTIS